MCHPPHLHFLLPRHKNTKNTQYITHISKLSQSTSCVIKNHSGVKTCRVAQPRAQLLPHKAKGWIRGDTKIGPVLELTINYHQGRYVIEIRINMRSAQHFVFFSTIFHRCVMRTNFEPQGVLHQLPVTDIPAPQSTVVHQSDTSSLLHASWQLDHNAQFECDTCKAQTCASASCFVWWSLGECFLVPQFFFYRSVLRAVIDPNPLVVSLWKHISSLLHLAASDCWRDWLWCGDELWWSILDRVTLYWTGSRYPGIRINRVEPSRTWIKREKHKRVCEQTCSCSHKAGQKFVTNVWRVWSLTLITHVNTVNIFM